MNGILLWVVASCLLIVTPGCLGSGGDAPADDEAVTPTDEDAAGDAATDDDASAPANETQPPVPEPAPAASPPPPPPPVTQRVSIPVSLGGTLGPSVTSPALGPGVTVTSDRWFHVEADGTVDAATLTLTWTPEGVGTENLRMFFGEYEEVEGGETAKEGYTVVTGPSPLALTAQGLGLSSGKYVVAVWWDLDTTVAAHVDQPFTIEGTVEALITS